MPDRLTIAIVPSAKEGCYDFLAGTRAVHSLEEATLDAMLSKLEPGDYVLYDVRKDQQRRAA